MTDQAKAYQTAILSALKRVREGFEDSYPEFCDIIEEFEDLYMPTTAHEHTFESLYLLNLDLYMTLVITEEEDLQERIAVVISLIESFPSFFV